MDLEAENFVALQSWFMVIEKVFILRVWFEISLCNYWWWRWDRFDVLDDGAGVLILIWVWSRYFLVSWAYNVKDGGGHNKVVVFRYNWYEGNLGITLYHQRVRCGSGLSFGPTRFGSDWVLTWTGSCILINWYINCLLVIWY